MTGTAAEPENQPVLVSVTAVHEKKCWKRKSSHLGKEETLPLLREEVDEADYSKAGPSREQEGEEAELINEAVTAQSLSLSELRDKQKDFSRRPGKHIVTWLLRCWDNGAIAWN